MAKVSQPSKARLYALSIMAFKHEDGDLTIAHCAAYITAENAEDAKLTGMMISAPEAFPTSEGWFDHAVAEAEIPQELLRVPLKAWSKLDCGPEREQ